MDDNTLQFCAEQIAAQLTKPGMLHIALVKHGIRCGLERGIREASDQELRDELQRRIAERKAANTILRCRDCKHCGEGHCHKNKKRYMTSVCFKKPKPQAGEDRYYAVNVSSKACEMFEPK